MQSFFRTRPNPYYVVQGSVIVGGDNSARATVEAKWEEACPQEWAQETFLCERHVRLEVTAQLDEQGRISVLEEAAGAKYRYRVAVDSIWGFEEPHSGCEDYSHLPGGVELPKGAVIESTGRYILGFGCGPCEGLVQFRHDGQTYWTLRASCTREYDPVNGPYTGGVDYLSEVK